MPNCLLKIESLNLLFDYNFLVIRPNAVYSLEKIISLFSLPLLILFYLKKFPWFAIANNFL